MGLFFSLTTHSARFLFGRLVSMLFFSQRQINPQLTLHSTPPSSLVSLWDIVVTSFLFKTGGYLLDYMLVDWRKRQLEMQSSVSIWEDHCSPVSCPVHKITTPVLEMAPFVRFYVSSVILPNKPCCWCAVLFSYWAVSSIGHHGRISVTLLKCSNVTEKTLGTDTIFLILI